MSFLPKSRTQEYKKNSDGKTVFRCYSPLNPHYYKDSNGDYHSIDLSHTSSLSNSNVGNFTLKDKNIHSLGIRQDNNKEKYIGVRPDETQDGSQQFEWTIISASVNGNNIPIDLSKNDFVNNNQVDLGNVTLFSTRRYMRQMLHYTGSINDFKLEYKIHLRGLKVSGSKYTSSTTLSNSNNVSIDTNYYKENNDNEFVILDDDNNIKYKITEPVLLDSNFNIVETSGSVHTLKDNGDGTYNYTKYPTSSSINNISSSVNYIDGTTVYSTAGSDGDVRKISTVGWDNVHDHTIGDEVRTSETEILTTVYNYLDGFTVKWLIRRGFLSFDTSGISDAFIGTINVFGKSSAIDDPIIFVEWDEGPTLTTADYDGFTSTTYTDATGTLIQNQYNSASLNPDAITQINSAARLDTMIREHTHDYLDVQPAFGQNNLGGLIYSSDESGTSKDPFIEVFVYIPPSSIKINSGKLFLNGGKLIIK
jgi:hypothetical protein